VAAGGTLGRSVAARIVDVFLKDRLVVSYELLWDILNAPLFDLDFIDRAKARLQEAGYAP
jgi:hypothetical protein